MNSKGFHAPYGPTTAEQRHPGFKISYQGHECQWNGPSWPMATSVTMTALANVLNNYEQDAISKQDYFCLDELNYKGRVLTIIWDRSGEKYGRGKGLTILVDGKKVAHSQKLERLTAALK